MVIRTWTFIPVSRHLETFRKNFFTSLTVNTNTTTTKTIVKPPCIERSKKKNKGKTCTVKCLSWPMSSVKAQKHHTHVHEQVKVVEGCWKHKNYQQTSPAAVAEAAIVAMNARQRLSNWIQEVYPAIVIYFIIIVWLNTLAMLLFQSCSFSFLLFVCFAFFFFKDIKQKRLLVWLMVAVCFLL